MLRQSGFILFIFLTIILSSCQNGDSNQATIFKKIGEKKSGISFTNHLIETDSLNYLNYAYIYMGGGVSAGDINNDGLVDLYFTGNQVENKLFLNKGNLKFEDITNTAELSGDDRWYTGVTMADVNGDGFIDIYCSVGGKYGPRDNQLFMNNGDNTFTEKAKEYGIDNASHSVQSTFFDYDLDGDLDLYVANYPPTSFAASNKYYEFKRWQTPDEDTDKLFRNDGNQFTDVTDDAGLRSFGLSLSATISDVNQDGYPDIYVSNDFSTPDYFFLNNGDGTFTDHLKDVTKQTAFYGMGVDIADFNNDKLVDIYQVDMSPQSNRRSKANMASMDIPLFWSTVNSGFHYQYMQNNLQLNNGTINDGLPDFSNISRLAGVASTDWSWGPLFADLDNDGWKDIYVTNGTRREINNRDFFLDLEKNPVAPENMLAKVEEIPSEKIDNYILRNNKDLTFERANEDWGMIDVGFSNGAVYADLDNDGDLDIVANNIDSVVSLFENKSSNSSNYLNLNFVGPAKNTDGLGVKVSISHDENDQFQELTLSRGFQSSVDPRLHFGLGDSDKIEQIKITWPDGKVQEIKDIDANQFLDIFYTDASMPTTENQIANSFLFESQSDILEASHQENYYDDFIEEVLLPHQTSRFGPAISVGDLNGDGKDDFILGGAKDSPTQIFLQKGDQLESKKSLALQADAGSEDLGSIIFDADNDGDNDIYMVSGGNEFDQDSELLFDRLYLNDGKANFTKAVGAIPTVSISGGRVKSIDYDKDGDLDLFVSGRLNPKNYPLPTSSQLLENNTQNGKVVFTDVTAEKAPMLNNIGMVTDASVVDYNNDGWDDIILTGEWMQLQALENSKGEFKDQSTAMQLEDTVGWWFSIQSADFDGDGDQDFIAGNLGENYKYRADENATFDIYFDDFDENSKGDIVLSYKSIDGEEYPVRGRECSSQQIPVIKKKFKNYESFANATVSDIYTENSLENSLHYQVKSFASSYFENTPDGFVRHDLPNLAQISSVNQIISRDFNKDGILDILLAGNLHSSEVETPRNDASNGVILFGDGDGNFIVSHNRENGWYSPGDVKDMAEINIDDQDYIVVAKNNDKVQLVEVLK